MNANVNTNTNIANLVVETADEQMNGYVNRFKFYANKSAENVLEMAKVVFDASEFFKTDPFRKFCTKVGLTDKGTISKMKKIGKRYATLAPYMGILPSAWTTLYSIAKATDKEFADAIEENKLSIFTRSSDIAEIFPSLQRERKAIDTTTVAQVPANDFLFKLSSATTIASEKRKELEARLYALCKDFGVELIAA